MSYKKEPIEGLMQELGASGKICKVLITVFPDNEFAKHFALFKDAVSHPISLKPFISQIQKQLNVGAFSHTTMAMNHFLAMDSNFEVFTRDYVRRCCDMVEYITKRKVAFRLRVASMTEKQPLGKVITIFNKECAKQFPSGLLESLTLFNKDIYCPAKHETVSDEESRMFSVADAIAITFIAIRLCQQLDDFQRTHWG
jgi:hypothetical protein